MVNDEKQRDRESVVGGYLRDLFSICVFRVFRGLNLMATLEDHENLLGHQVTFIHIYILFPVWYYVFCDFVGLLKDNTLERGCLNEISIQDLKKMMTCRTFKLAESPQGRKLILLILYPAATLPVHYLLRY